MAVDMSKWETGRSGLKRGGGGEEGRRESGLSGKKSESAVERRIQAADRLIEKGGGGN